MEKYSCFRRLNRRRDTLKLKDAFEMSSSALIPGALLLQEMHWGSGQTVTFSSSRGSCSLDRMKDTYC